MAPRFIERGHAANLNSKLKWDMLSPYLLHHGRGAFAYASLQDNLEYYVDESLGYLAFTTVRHPIFAPKGKRVVLGDPICAIENIKELVTGFLERISHAVFVPVSEECGTTLQKLGFKVNCVGYEPLLSIQSYNTTGDWKELDLIKRARNEAKREKISIEEIVNRNDLPLEMKSVSEKWLSNKMLNNREIWFFARRPLYAHEPDVRKFIASSSGQIIGFAFYDPLYSNGSIYGYSTNINRSDESRYNKLSVAMHMHATDVFKSEGKQILNLCIAPFHKIEKGKMNDDWLTHHFFNFMYNYGDEVYNFKGLSFHKSKYRAKEKSVYFASNSILPVHDVYLTFRASHIVCSYGEVIIKLVRSLFKKSDS